MKNFVKLLTIVSAFSLLSCDRLLFEEEMASKNPRDNFEYLWKQCNDKYSFFTLKKINWDEIKIKYSSKIYEDMSQDSLFNVLGSMLTELKDDHTNLFSNFNISNFKVHNLSQDNFDLRVITDNYLGQKYYSTGPFTHDFIANGQIGYINFPAFTGTVDNTNLDFILERYKNTKGIILDLRENGGGRISDIGFLTSRFVEEKTLVYYSRIKTGPGKEDFSESLPVYATPHNGIRYKKKLVVLIDRGTYSAGSFAALAFKALPNTILIGDTTGGGLGEPNGGQLPNGWTYRFSVTQTLNLDKSPEYENGVPPDIHVLFDWSNLKKDEIIEKAIFEIL